MDSPTAPDAMSPAERAEIVNTGFERLADALGDITDPVMERYYHRYPAARASFDHHGLFDRRGLEARMVEQSIYFLLAWPEDPAQLRIIISESTVHHHDTLDVIPQWYVGMIDAVVELVFEVLGPDEHVARNAWLAIRDELAREIDRARHDCLKQGADGPMPRFDPAALHGR